MTSPVGGVPRTSVCKPMIHLASHRTKRQYAWQPAIAPSRETIAHGKYTSPTSGIVMYIKQMKIRDRTHWIA
jgi:hypothetical protein